MLLKNDIVAKNMTREEIQKILDPEGYTGHAGEIVDRVLTATANARAKYNK